MKPEKIAQLRTADECRGLMTNAERLGNEEVHRLAFQRLCVLAGEAEEIDDEREREFAQVLAAHEELLSQKNGRKTKATRLRAKYKAKGLNACLADWPAAPDTTANLETLAQHGLGAFTGDYLIVKHADEFDTKIVAAATKRLKKHDIDLPEQTAPETEDEPETVADKKAAG
ncbi:MAG: hypothetical protein CMF74_06515 [Maricaulis sp.]|jgi:hypothetical protein|nr:hypothetical protein [Maricaulis sp.]|tara:strand:+ start:1690 stop:2205 length:516 start_codon:yes stop_codon:yes gene_type:complete